MRPAPPDRLPRMRRQLPARPHPPRMRARPRPLRLLGAHFLAARWSMRCVPWGPLKCDSSLFGKELLLSQRHLNSQRRGGGVAGSPSRAAGPPQERSRAALRYTSQRQAVRGGRRHYLPPRPCGGFQSSPESFGFSPPHGPSHLTCDGHRRPLSPCALLTLP